MNFALILFLLLVFTGIAWLADKAFFAPRRRAAGVERQPWWLEYTAGLFPVILVVFFLRSFIAEPFKIPSGSMLPTLLIGDLILVNKYTYGVRLPVVHTKVLAVGQPARGDVMVFRYPHDTSMDYIKRVVGIPGDKITFKNNRLEINGQLAPLKPEGEFYDSERVAYYRQYSEKVGEVEHKILTELEKTTSITPMEFALKDQCRYDRFEVSCTVPPGHFFVMGDNRDNSQDSRFWGFVPEANIVGKAFFIWMNLSNPGRIGRFH